MTISIVLVVTCYGSTFKELCAFAKEISTESINADELIKCGDLNSDGQINVFDVMRAIIGFTGIYRGIYFTITYSIAALEKSPLLIQVCWEQIFNGKLFFEIILCILICFVTNIKHIVAKEQ